MRRVARICPPVACLLAASLGLAAPVRAEPSAEPTTAPPREPPAGDARARLEAIYSAANKDTVAGNFAAAADRYAEILDLLPETLANHESRALALLDSVGARREAYARTRDPLQLCRARDLLRAYLAATRTTYGSAAAELDGPRQATRIEAELADQLADVTGPDMALRSCPGDQTEPVTVAPAPTPTPTPTPPPRRDPRVVAGATLLGVAGGSLGLMALGLGLGAAAESRGRDALMADPAPDIDDLLADGFYQRGRAANRLAVAGAVLAGVALTTGAALLLAARVRPRRLALSGVGLGLRF